MFVDRVEPVGEVGAIAMQPLHLVQPQGGNHRELGYVDLDLKSVDDPFHEISTNHLSDPGLQIAAGYVLMGLAWFKDRLLPYNAVAFHLAPREPGIGDVPMPAQQLDGVIALIFYCDPIREYVMILAGAGIRWLVFRLHTYLDPLRYFRDHTTKNINFFQFQNLPADLMAVP